MVAPTSFPRGKKPLQAKQPPAVASSDKAKTKKRKNSSADAPAVVESEAAAGPDALFGRKGVAATGGVAAKADDKQRKAAKKPRVEAAATPAGDKQDVAPALSFKGLKKGMRLLGCVRQVNDGYDLLVSLPNKLTGTVSLVECSDEFYAHQEQQKQRKSKPRGLTPAGEQEDEDEALPKLSDIFSVGQFVPVVVLGTAKEGKHRQIHLSLRMSLVHAELTPQVAARGVALHASVSSVEDHGAVVNLGIRGLTAFVPRKDLPSGGVHKGQLLFVSVASVNTHTLTVTVTPERSLAVKAVTRGDAFTLPQLVPGMLLNVRVEEVLATGLRVHFLSFFSGTVEQSHMSLPCRRGWEDAYRKGIKGRARIISVDAVNKQICLSMAPHVVHLQTPEWSLDVGDTVDAATIERIDSGIGMLLSLPRKASAVDGDGDETMDTDSGANKSSWKAFSPAYVHISNLADERVDRIEKRFSVGGTVKCRVIGFAPFDGLVQVSCKPSSLQQAVLRHKDLVPGMKVSGKILAIDTWGVLLELGEGVRGVVPAKHVPPFVQLKKAGRTGKGDGSGRFQVGRAVDARVLRVDASSKKTYLTLKKALVASELPALSSFEDATMGLVAHGVVTKIADYGVVVSFFGDVYGLVPAGVLRQAGVTDLERAYALGQVVKARVTRCDVTKQRLTLSFDASATVTASNSSPITSPAEAPAIVGQTVRGVRVVDVEASCFRVQTPDGLDGVLPFVQLTDFPRQTALVDALASRYSAGDVLATPALAISQSADGVVTFSLKPLLLSLAASTNASAAGPKGLPKVFSDVEAGAVLVGFVASVNANIGVFVKFLNNLVAVAPKALLADKFTAEIADDMFETGETVVCRVERVDAAKQQFVVGFRGRELLARAPTPAFFAAFAEEAAAAALLPAGSSLTIGKAEKGEFLGVRPYGAVFSVETKGADAVTVVVPAPQADASWEEGARVKLVATDYDFAKRVYYGAVDAELVQAASSKGRKKAVALRLAAGAKVAAATVVAVGATGSYVVASFEAGGAERLGVVQLSDFWAPSTTSAALELDVGSVFSARVVSPSLPSGAAFSPFQGLPLLAYEPEDVLAASGRSKAGNDAYSTSTSGLPKYSATDLVVGQLLTGRVSGVNEATLDIRLKTSKRGGKVVASVSIADVDELVSSGGVRHPFDRFQPHETVTGRVISVTAKGAHKLKPVGEDNPAVFHMVALSLRAADVEGGDEDEDKDEVKDTERTFVRPDWAEGSAGRALLRVGASLEGVVAEHLAGSLVLRLSHRVAGYVSLAELSDDADAVDHFRSHWPVGKRVTAFVLAVDETKQRVDMSLVRSAPLSAAALQPGNVVLGVLSPRVAAVKPPAVMVQLGAHVHGRACSTELLPPAQWRNGMHELPQFSAQGKAVRCVVLATTESAGGELHVDLSLREDALADPSAYAAAWAAGVKKSDSTQLKVGELVTGVVVSTGKSGCFVRLERGATARVLLRELSDDFVADPAAAFPAGTLVAGRVTSASARGVELSLKASVVAEDAARLRWQDLAEGMTVKGTITKVQPYGVFVRVDGSAISGLCHVSEVADERVTRPLDQVFAEGDYVKAKVLRVEDRRVSFGLKPSYFADEESSDEEEGESEDESDAEEEDAAEPMDVDDEEEEEEEAPVVKAKAPVIKVKQADASSSSSDEEDAAEDGADAKTAPVEFAWDGFVDALGPAADGEASDSDSDEEEQEEKPVAAGASTRRPARPSDEWVAMREKALAADADAPASAGDFERLLAAAPHSSFLWIQYMAFHVSLTEVALARDVAARATAAVASCGEAEKLNVWVAALNLEHDFGDAEGFQRVFDRALAANRPKRVYLHLVDLYARAGELADAERTLITMQKKFKGSKQPWLRSLQLHVGQGALARAAETLQRALRSLALHKQLPVILRYGQLMFEAGELDKARTIFEGVLANYPKRVDLWSVYVDKEVKCGLPADASGGVARVRGLFDRLLAMDFSAKKMRFWFKKALQFEQAHGDAAGVARVQQLARDFVAQAAGKQ